MRFETIIAGPESSPGESFAARPRACARLLTLLLTGP